MPRRLLMHTALFALLMAREDAVKTTAARTTMIVIVTSNSVRVKPLAFGDFMTWVSVSLLAVYKPKGGLRMKRAYTGLTRARLVLDAGHQKHASAVACKANRPFWRHSQEIWQELDDP